METNMNEETIERLMGYVEEAHGSDHPNTYECEQGMYRSCEDAMKQGTRRAILEAYELGRNSK